MPGYNESQKKQRAKLVAQKAAIKKSAAGPMARLKRARQAAAPLRAQIRNLRKIGKRAPTARAKLREPMKRLKDALQATRPIRTKLRAINKQLAQLRKAAGYRSRPRKKVRLPPLRD